MTCCGNPLGGGGGGGGSITPLSRLHVVDPSGGGSTIDGAFSGAQAFTTLAAAIAAAASGTALLLMPHDYSGEGALSWAAKSLGFVALGADAGATVLPPLTSTGSGDITIDGCQTADVTSAGFIELDGCTIGGTLTAAGAVTDIGNVRLRNCWATSSAAVDGALSTDLASFNAVNAHGGTITPSIAVDFFDSKPDPQVFYVNPNAYPHGNGTAAAPFNLLGDAVGACPGLPGFGVIYLAPGDYSAEGRIEYTDKRICFAGAFLLNESPIVPTHGVLLGVTSSSGTLEVELIRTNSNLIARSAGILCLLQDAHCEAIGDGTHAADFSICGTSSVPTRFGTEGTLQGSCNCTNGGMLAPSLWGGAVTMVGGATFAGVAGTAIEIPNVFGVSTFNGCNIAAAMTIGGVCELYDCTFPADASAVVLSGAFRTDLATYARGVAAGVTWPGDTTIVDVNVQLQPFYVASGAGSNSGGNATPGYGTNIVNDRFVCRVNAVGGSAPTMPAGWTKQKEQVSGPMISQLWTRDAPSTGGEVGTVTVTNVGGSLPLTAIIDTWRNVAASAFIESISGASATSGGSPIAQPGPTVTATGKGRTAVACCFSNGGATGATAITGNTGGTWIDQATGQFNSGLGSLVDVQTAALADSATITGGAGTMPGTRTNVIGFAFIGAVT